jgi:hypothetical protein
MPTPSVSLSADVRPLLAGRLCIRALQDGDAMVGLVQLPSDFVPQEGAAYLMVESADGAVVVTQALDQGATDANPDVDPASGVNDLLRAAIWPRTRIPEARAVRFFEAFPESNHWVVFGPSSHAPPPAAPVHRWLEITDQGLTPLAPPLEATGMAMGQILSMHAIWPDAQGTPHTLPQLPSEWRGHMHRYQQLLAQSTRDPELDARLETVVAQDPHFRTLNVGRIDRAYCAFLAALESQGLLTPDAPRNAAEVARRDQASLAIVQAQMTDQPLSNRSSSAATTETGASDTPRRRRTP